MTDAAAYLSRLLAPHVALDEDTLAALAERLRPVRFAAGETLYAHGAVCRSSVLLEAGLVRAYYLHDGREVNLRLICAPAVATAMASLITGQPSGEWVEAITPVVGYRSELDRVEHPALRVIVGQLQRVLVEQHYLALERRLRMLQWKTVAERYAFFREHMEPDIVARTPGYHVASYLGVAPETLSRVRRRALLDQSQ